MRLLDRIRKIEDAIGSPHARYMVFVAPRDDTPEAIKAAIMAEASRMGIMAESIDTAWLFFDNELREHQINPYAASGRLSDNGVMKEILAGLKPSTGLPPAEIISE